MVSIPKLHVSRFGRQSGKVWRKSGELLADWREIYNFAGDLTARHHLKAMPENRLREI